MTTMLEVAKRAGVPKVTVSRVLPGNDHVSQGIRDRVSQAIEESGYRPNLLARSFTAKTTQTLGLVVTSTLYHGICFNRLLFHTVRMAEDKGRQLLLTGGKHSAREECQAIQYLLDLRCDAATIYPCSLSVDKVDDIIDAYNWPIMVLNQRLRKSSSHSVWCDQKQTGFNAVTQLIATGYKEIGFITGSMDPPTGAEQLSDYKDVLAHHGIALNNDLTAKRKWAPACDAAGVDILSSRKIDFIALIASNGNMTIGATKQLHKHDISVPARVSMIDFDDIALAPYIISILSSVKIPVTEMIQETTGRLTFMLSDGVFTSLETFTDELIARDSVAPPASH